MDAIILSQGDEVITGQVVDTNAAWLAEALTDRGFRIIRHLVVGDRLPHLIDTFRDLVGHAPVVLCTGGLGPTDDDLTVQAIAQAMGIPLDFHEPSWARIEALYQRMGRPVPVSNRKQALLPQGSAPLPNARGTAPGFRLSWGATTFFCLPGVPHEMKAMFRAQVEPWLRREFAVRPGRLVTLRITGMGESAVQDRIRGLAEPGIEISTRSFIAENHLKLRASPEVSTATLAAFADRLSRAIGPGVYGIDGLPPAPEGSLPERIAHHLTGRQHTLSIAESCTGGRLMAACTAWPGSSAWFLEGVCTYSNAAKVRQLGVPENTLASHGAVSEAVARAMSEGIRLRSNSTWGISTTGVAGPGGGSPAKPVGTVHVAVTGPQGTTHQALLLPGDRQQVQERAVAAALHLLHQQLASSLTPGHP